MTATSDFFSRFRRHWLSAVFFMVPFGLYLVGTMYLKIPELYQHLLLTVTAVMGIHLLDRLYLSIDTQNALDRLTNGIRHDISGQTRSLLSSSKSLEAINQCGIVQIYPSRVEAAEDIRSDITYTGNSRLLLMGISLNDFVQGMDQTLMDAWSTVQQLVRGETRIDDPAKGLDIRTLIIDPLCFGAVLRSEAESVSASALAKRLEQDVQAAARDLKNLTASAVPEQTGVTFECRLYRLPPILFLSWVDSVCYVQPYHFWSFRDNRTPMPVLKFRRLPASAYPYHKEMEHHFDWIWKNASISVEDYIDGKVVGTDHGIYSSAAVNVYTDPIKASERMVYLLKAAKTKVSIQGVSLNSFFKPGALREAVSGVAENGVAELELLLLDPDCEQAKYRSYRERLFVSPGENYDDYLRQGDHEKSDLYRDTKRTIENIGQMVSDVGHTKDEGWTPKLKVGIYQSAPACFVLRIDDRILVEQYHYGKIAAPQTRAILGKDMPLVEYSQKPSELYIDDSDPSRRPFDLLVDHLMFVLAQASMLKVWPVAQPVAPADR